MRGLTALGRMRNFTATACDHCNNRCTDSHFEAIADSNFDADAAAHTYSNSAITNAYSDSHCL
jgi:hypothetical protein